MEKKYPNWNRWPQNKTALIAEIGSNHGGQPELAWDMIQSAHQNGADFVKLQSFETSKFFHPSLPYFKNTQQLELSREVQTELFQQAKRDGIELMTTPFDIDMVDFLETLDPAAYKIASMDSNFHPLIEAVAKTQKPIIISFGMAQLEEMKQACETILKTGNENIVTLHCVSEYPAQPETLNLSMIEYIQKELGHYAGLSDHTLGLESSYYAASQQVAVIEKHFTTDRQLEEKIPDADHELSLEPAELLELSKYCQVLPKMLGQSPRTLSQDEENGRTLYRRGLYAQNLISAGQTIEAKDLDYLRPVQGISAGEYKTVIGKKAKQEIQPGKAITSELID